MNIAGVQRAVFRMQHDAVFAARVLDGDPEALRSTALGAEELAALRAAPATAYTADRGGKRLGQFLRNVSSEFRACVALGPGGVADESWLVGFVQSAEFHGCVHSCGRLPLAFRDYAARLAREAGATQFGALVALEGSLAEARRSLVARRRPGPGDAVLAPWVRLVETPVGTHALAAALRDGGRTASFDLTRNEWVLVTASAAPPPPGGLREVQVEVLGGAVASFLQTAERPHPVAEWSGFAARFALSIDAVEAVAGEFVAEGVLLLGETASGPARPRRPGRRLG